MQNTIMTADVGATKNAEPKLLEHQALEPLREHIQSALLKGLKCLPGHSFDASAIEAYAFLVTGRMVELESSISSLRLSIDYLKRDKAEFDNRAKHHTYHYENFLFRLVGLADRAYLLVGSELQLDEQRLGRHGANAYVSKSLSRWPSIKRSLKDLEKTASLYRPARNKVAHSEEYSTRELGLFKSAADLQILQGLSDGVRSLEDDYFSKDVEVLEKILYNVIEGLERIVQSLSPVFWALADESEKEKALNNTLKSH